MLNSSPTPRNGDGAVGDLVTDDNDIGDDEAEKLL